MSLIKIPGYLFLAVVFICFSPGWMYSQSQNHNEAQIEALQKRLDSLQSQMSDVQEEIKKLSPGLATTPEHVTEDTGQKTGTIVSSESSEAETEFKLSSLDISKATSSYETSSQDPLAAPRIDNEPLDPRYPGYFRLPGTKTFLRIGGYFKTDFIYDLKPAGDPDRFITASIPIPSPTTVNNTTVSVRPTRLNLDFLIPAGNTSVRFFVEGDLFGSSATTPRLRHAYAQVKNFLLGQTFSNFMDPDSGPDQLDFEGPNAQISIRNPQIRYSFRLRPKTTFSLAVEKASSDIAFKVEDFSALPNNPAPDGTLQLRREMDRGHVQLAAILRDVSGFLANGKTGSVFAWGLNLTGSEKIIGRDTVVYQVEYGNGIERYVQDTSGLGIDAAPESNQDKHLKALPVVGTYGAYQHFWTPKLRSSVIYGYVDVKNTAFQPGSAFHQTNYSAGNIIWNVFGSLNVGTEFLYGWRVNKDGSSGNAPRIMISAKYNFVKTQPTK